MLILSITLLILITPILILLLAIFTLRLIQTQEKKSSFITIALLDRSECKGCKRFCLLNFPCTSSCNMSLFKSCTLWGLNETLYNEIILGEITCSLHIWQLWHFIVPLIISDRFCKQDQLEKWPTVSDYDYIYNPRYIMCPPHYINM